MSESASTFSSPTSATTGLQGYDLEKPVRTLYPGPAISQFRLRAQRIASAKRRPKGGLQYLHKDVTMPDVIEAMVGTLSKSVADIIAANTPDRDALLAKSFNEFAGAIGGTLDGVLEDELAKRATDLDPMFKGLGAVGRIADLVSYVAKSVKALKEGKESWQEKVPEDADLVSEDVSDLLDHGLAAFELALRAAVNEHVDIADDDDDDLDGMTLVQVPGEDGHHIVVKTVLPGDLAKFATMPERIEQASVELGARLLLQAGVPEHALAKAVSGGDLAKSFPPKKGGEDDPGDAQGGEGEDVSPDDDLSSGDYENDEENQLDVLGRILAAGMIQLEHIRQTLYGPGDGQDDQTTQDSGAAPDNQPPVGKSAPGAGDLRKDNPADPRVEQLQREVTELNHRLAKMAGQPMPAKAYVGPTAALSKGADSLPAGSTTTEEALRKRAAEIDALPEEQRVFALTKLALARPVHGGPAPGAVARQ